ncbi:threonine ammonia-lyase [Streptomyces beigongshangae]|uniref:threonine ammonia-lyase n=1 Tax=Streptomyces beigongshangae TaxID=2841597 RepID=UPI001C84F0EB|nr:pyridoxal-phosphate dependent enzyme [Streptomyces sp. REN17]
MSVQQKERLKPLRTRLIRLQPHGWRSVLVKDETRQISGAFKYRGNAHKVAGLSAGSTLATASTGNHASGLAEAASARGLSLRVFVPRTTPLAKRQRITGAGAEVVLVDGGYDDCEVLARKYADDNGAVFVHSFDDPDIIEGHRSLYREVREDAELPDAAFVPVGGGGLVAAGIAEWGRAATRIVGVEYQGAPAMQMSLRAGRRITLDSARGLPEGLLVRRIGARSFQTCRDYGLEIRTVNDGELHRAMRILWAEAGIRAEGAGAAAFAAALQDPDPCKAALCVVSGGNIDDQTWSDCILG